jgi:ATP-dependent Clp protease ATP-binding subunit ClpB
MTSNLGSDLIQEHAKEHTYEQMKAEVMEVLGRHFRPEFINRVDDTVVFHPLGEAEIRSIAQFQLQLLFKRLEEKDFEIEVDDDALAHLARTGFDPVFGARPLKRAIQHELENPLAQKILSGEIQPAKPIKVSVENEALVISQ